MKQLKYIGIMLSITCLLSACGNDGSAVNQLVNSRIEAETASEAAADRGAGFAETSLPSETVLETQKIDWGAGSDVDIDLTRMSGTMVYSEVYNMLMYPDRYIGKTVRVSGDYYASYWEENDIYYQYVLIADAAACCEQGLEFIWDEGAHSYPEEYPEDFTAVEIVGTFAVYEEDGYEYCYLATDEIIIR